MSDNAFSIAGFISAVEQSVSRAFMDFDKSVSLTPNALFAFYEGNDSDYYYPRLRQYAGRDISPIKCGNKSMVIQVYKTIVAKPEYEKYRKGFFIDKDFDQNNWDFLSDFYVTGGYSIENFYLGDSCMEAFLIQTYCFHKGDAVLESLMDDFRKMRQHFFDAIMLFNTWYCAIKRHYGSSIREINLEPTMPKGFISYDFSKKEVYRNYTMATIESSFPAAAYPISPAEISAAELYIKSNMVRNIRGKYGMWFLFTYISNLQKVIKTDPVCTAHYRNFPISKETFMSVLSSFADTDQDLINYIQQVTT